MFGNNLTIPEDSRFHVNNIEIKVEFESGSDEENQDTNNNENAASTANELLIATSADQ